MPDRPPTVAQRTARLRRDNHVDVVTGLIVVVFVVLRLWATLGSPITAYPDSPSYFEFRLWGGVRFPVITAIYAIVGDHRAVVTVQAILGAVCWSLAAVIAGALVIPRGLRYAFQIALLLLGLTLPMTRFDNALLSESFSISVAVVLATLSLRLVCRPSTRLTIIVFVVAALWAMMRQNNALLLAVGAVAVLVLCVGGTHRRIAAALAAGFVLLALLGVLLASSNNQIEQYNTAQLLDRRIVHDRDRNAWFRARGMPDAEAAFERQRALSPDGNIDNALALQHDPIFGRWLLHHGPRTYLRYLATHPSFALSTPLTDDEAFQGYVRGVTAYGSSRRVVPKFVDTVFWPQEHDERTFMQIYVAIGLVAVIVRAVLDRRARRAAYAGYAVLLVSLANLFFVTDLAGLEYARLMLSAAAVGRVAILWLFATSIGDADLRDRESDQAVPASA